MTEWIQRGGTGIKSDCGRFTLHSCGAYGLWSLYDYEGENWVGRTKLREGRMAPSVSTFRSIEAAKHEAARRMNK